MTKKLHQTNTLPSHFSFSIIICYAPFSELILRPRPDGLGKRFLWKFLSAHLHLFFPAAGVRAVIRSWSRHSGCCASLQQCCSAGVFGVVQPSDA